MDEVTDWDWLRQPIPQFFGRSHGYIGMGTPYDYRLEGQPLPESPFSQQPKYSLGEGIVPETQLFPKVIPNYGPTEQTPASEWLGQKAFPPASGYSSVAPTGSPSANPASQEAWPIGALAAGLGMLANNTGHYGAFGPAFGRGGLMGLEAYGAERDRQTRVKQIADEAAMRREQIGINRTQAEYVGKKAKREEDREAQINSLIEQRDATTDPIKQRSIDRKIAILQGDAAKIYTADTTKPPKPVKSIEGAGGDKVKEVWRDPITHEVAWEGEPYTKSAGIQISQSMPPLEKKEQQGKGELNVKAYDAIKVESDQAAKSIPQLQTMLDINNRSRMGWSSPVRESISSALDAMGVKDGGQYATDAQKFRAFLSESVMQAQLAQKGPQTESDAKRLEQTQARLTNTNDANDFLIRYRIAQANRARIQKRFFDTYWKDKNTYEGADTAWEDGPGKSSLFDDPVLQKYGQQQKPKMGSGYTAQQIADEMKRRGLVK